MRTAMRVMQIFLLVAFSLASVATANKYGNAADVEVGDAYDPNTERCCGTKPFSLADHHRFYLCCGNERYDRTCQVCCNDAVHEMKAGFSCCGKQYHDTKTQFCCTSDLTIRDIPDAFKDKENAGKFLQCCGTDSYDERSHSCCNGKLVAKDSQRHVCCGDSTINSLTQLCCDGTVMELNGTKVGKSTHNCCGKVLFNVRTQICCGSTLFNKDGGKVCCGNEQIDRKEQFCCIHKGQGYVSPKPAPGTEKCCNDKAFNSKTHLCCANNQENVVVEKKDPKDSACCGDNPYNSYTHVCCNDTVVEKQDKTHTSCCGKFTYNPKGMICCHDQSLSQYRAYKLAHGHACCGIVPYFPRIETCTDGQVGPKSKADIKKVHSCAGKLYNKDTHICCRDNVTFKEKTNATYACCSRDAYIPGEQICCRETHVRQIANPAQKTCCMQFNVKPSANNRVRKFCKHHCPRVNTNEAWG